MFRQIVFQNIKKEEEKMKTNRMKKDLLNFLSKISASNPQFAVRPKPEDW
jgi:hypothetical protein